MDIIKLTAIGIITAFCVLILRESRADIALLIGLVGGVIILISVIDMLSDIFVVLGTISSRAGLGQEFVSIIIRIVGIGFVVDFAAGICEDAGSRSLGDKIMLAGKVAIMYCALPIVVALFEIIAGWL